ncbi:MAG TPA: DUF2339 domain-containing protein, partial [Bacteroidales bacterium]|nr:DUF2339 domain-containing protein [Bacteroidales bacterium]
MEFLTFVAIVVLLLIFLINVSNIKSQLNDISKEITRLRESLSRIEKTEKPFIRPEMSSAPKESPKKVPTEIREEIKEQLPSQKVTVSGTPEQSSYEDTVRAKLEAMQLERVPKRTVPPVPPKPPKQPTDFEKFIGENLISKIGIIILVLGVGFFVKYAIDQNWIGVYGRTAIGLLTGGILASIAHYLRKSFKTFSSLLTGGGFAVFYLTIAIAFHQYHIFDQTVAFIIMIVITLFSVLLSLAYDKKELAIFSQLGGYAAPFMVSTGDGNYVVLFTYLLILNAGILILAYFKRWYTLNLLAFIFTLVLFSGWIATAFRGAINPPYVNALIFATAFYMIFFLVNILNNVKERKPFKAVEITMILSNNLSYFLWGIAILYSYKNGAYKGLFTVLTGLFNFGWVLYLYHKKQVDKNLIYLLIALVMSYISLAIPIQLNGHSITLFWTAEVVILLWLSQLSGIRILKAGHFVIVILALISLAMDWNNLYHYYSKAMPVMINQAFITGIFIIAGLFVTVLLLRKEKNEDFIDNLLSVQVYRNVIHFI